MHGSLWQGWGCLTAWEFLLRGGAAILADSQNGDIITLPGCFLFFSIQAYLLTPSIFINYSLCVACYQPLEEQRLISAKKSLKFNGEANMKNQFYNVISVWEDIYVIYIYML
jgi:hypothetical protein